LLRELIYALAKLLRLRGVTFLWELLCTAASVVAGRIRPLLAVGVVALEAAAIKDTPIKAAAIAWESAWGRYFYGHLSGWEETACGLTEGDALVGLDAGRLAVLAESRRHIGVVQAELILGDCQMLAEALGRVSQWVSWHLAWILR